MKRLSICLPALALALALTLSCAASSPLPAHPLPKLAKFHVPPPLPVFHPPLLLNANPSTPDISFPAKVTIPLKAGHFDYIYYWFIYPYDQYNDWATLSQESFEWWVWLGGGVLNTNPMGGTLIACGYMSSVQPHIAYPAIYLYLH
jgi:hypothetical protein